MKKLTLTRYISGARKKLRIKCIRFFFKTLENQNVL